MAFIQEPPLQEGEPLSRTTKEGEGISSTFGSWVCAANCLANFNNSWANPVEPKGFASTPSHDIGNLADGLGKIELSDLIKNYASHIRANSHPSISPDDLIAGIDRVDNNNADCIKLAEVVLHQPD